MGSLATDVALLGENLVILLDRGSYSNSLATKAALIMHTCTENSADVNEPVAGIYSFLPEATKQTISNYLAIEADALYVTAQKMVTGQEVLSKAYLEADGSWQLIAEALSLYQEWQVDVWKSIAARAKRKYEAEEGTRNYADIVPAFGALFQSESE